MLPSGILLLLFGACSAVYHHYGFFQGSTGGAVYTRWGHKKCDATNAELVYSGFTAGGFYAHFGGQTNVLCLPQNPQLSKDKRKYTYYTYIYGSEYETYGGPPGSPTNHDVPCAVCQSLYGKTALMIPGYKRCPGHWKREYRGFLMGGHYSHRGSHESVCMDKKMQSLRGGYDNKDGLLWYFVLTICGSLKCPPYVKNQKIPCVVCSS